MRWLCKDESIFGRIFLGPDGPPPRQPPTCESVYANLEQLVNLLTAVDVRRQLCALPALFLTAAHRKPSITLMWLATSLKLLAPCDGPSLIAPSSPHLYHEGPYRPYSFFLCLCGQSRFRPDMVCFCRCLIYIYFNYARCNKNYMSTEPVTDPGTFPISCNRPLNL